MSAAWLTGDALAFDTETTGIDTNTARIVTAAIVVVGPNGLVRKREWLINPGVDIPARATEIHGVTNEMARAKGESPLDAIPAIAIELLSAWAMGLPVIIMNAPYDTTLMQEELERVAHDPLTLGPILDPLAIDRGCDPFRHGKRTLEALCGRYGVKQSKAHSAAGDALTAARVVWKQAQEHWTIAKHTLAQMQTWQAERHDEWAGQFEVWKRSQGNPAVIDRRWPCR